jgi:hypothetical protein
MDELKQARRSLGVPSNSSREQIRALFRAAAKVHHPDRGGSPEKFTELEKAYRLAVARAPLATHSPYIEVPYIEVSDPSIRLPRREAVAEFGEEFARPVAGQASFAEVLARQMA